MRDFVNFFCPLKQDDTCRIIGSDTQFVIDVLINGEALLKYRTKDNIFKMAHWQPINQLMAV